MCECVFSWRREAACQDETIGIYPSDLNSKRPPSFQLISPFVSSSFSLLFFRQSLFWGWRCSSNAARCVLCLCVFVCVCVWGRWRVYVRGILVLFFLAEKAAKWVRQREANTPQHVRVYRARNITFFPVRVHLFVCVCVCACVLMRKSVGAGVCVCLCHRDCKRRRPTTADMCVPFVDKFAGCVLLRMSGQNQTLCKVMKHISVTRQLTGGEPLKRNQSNH